MTDLEVMRGVRDHFVKNFDHAEDWKGNGGAHGGCLGQKLFILCGNQGYICTPMIYGGNDQYQRLRLSDLFRNDYFFMTFHSDKKEYLRKIENKIAQLEEHEVNEVSKKGKINDQSPVFA